MNFKKHLFLFAGILSCSFIMAQQQVISYQCRHQPNWRKPRWLLIKDPKTMWEVNGQDLKADQWLMFTIQTPGDVCELTFRCRVYQRKN
jgi:beta-glucosidase